MLSSQSQGLKSGEKVLDSILDLNMHKNPLSDNALMLKVKQGDLQKLGLLFERYKDILFAYFFKLSRDQVLAEDLVQSVFLRVIKYKHAYRGEGKFKTWIFHIARNIHVDNWKRESKLGQRVSGEISEILYYDDKENQQKEENIVRLERAMGKLNENQREILVLSKLKGMRYKEIGELLNLTESNVKIRVFRALKELKNKFEDIK